MISPRHASGAALAALLALAPALATAGAASKWARTPETSARLVAAGTAVGTAATLTVGLEIELAPGWKTYWRSPGDAGSPPLLDWYGSSNLAGAEVRWPLPERIAAFDLESLGYSGGVILPIRVRLQEPGRPLALKLKLDYQVCKDICIPVFADLALKLPAGPATASPHARALAKFEARVPLPSGAGALAIEGAWLRPAAETLEVRLRATRPLSAPELIVESDQPVYFGHPALRFGDDRRTAVATIPLSGSVSPTVLAGSEVTVTVSDGDAAAEARLTVGAGD